MATVWWGERAIPVTELGSTLGRRINVGLGVSLKVRYPTPVFIVPGTGGSLGNAAIGSNGSHLACGDGRKGLTNPSLHSSADTEISSALLGLVRLQLVIAINVWYASQVEQEGGVDDERRVAERSLFVLVLEASKSNRLSLSKMQTLQPRSLTP